MLPLGEKWTVNINKHIKKKKERGGEENIPLNLLLLLVTCVFYFQCNQSHAELFAGMHVQLIGT